ncbi:MAG: phosphopentomutase [Clostridia bacterium]|nr:phosphopentomutase [Clostridia bacterium]
MKKAVLIVLDSVGVGYLPDADKYGDVGACTLGHVVEKCQPALPNMKALGLGHIVGSGLTPDEKALGAYGRSMEASAGKDTTTGHWEMTGLKLKEPFPTYPNGFPKELMERFEAAIGTKTLGNYPASGTVILDELGEEHMRTGYPIVYTSADSVFQIACHEDVYPIEKLYEMCEIARGMTQVGRVIARPFSGKPGAFVRTPRRKDFSLDPQGPTLLDAVKAKGLDCLGVGKIEDIFNHRGLTGSNHASGNPACIDAALDYLQKGFNGLLFVNLVDFDMAYGHRNDPEGYAKALEYFDQKLPEIQSYLNEEDLLIITADHGCDPTFPGTDHTREHIPILCWRKGMDKLVNLGTRDTYADIAATVAEFLGLQERFEAASFYQEIK